MNSFKSTVFLEQQLQQGDIIVTNCNISLVLGMHLVKYQM